MRALALLLLLPLLAGCTGSPLGGGELTAKEAASRGADRARQWQADAVLAAVWTLEAPAGSPLFRGEADFSAALPPVPDRSIGDGRTAVWWLQYRSPSTNSSLDVAVAANGTVLADDAKDSPRDAALQGWEVDSPRAIEVAMQNATFAQAVRAPGAGLTYALGGGSPDSTDPHWFLMAGVNESPGGMMLVNARTAEPRPLPDFGPGFPFGSGLGGCRVATETVSGTLDPQVPSASHPFMVDPGCGSAVVDLEWQGTLPTDRVALSVERGSEELQPEEETPGNSSYAARYATRAGGHEARVELASDGPVPLRATYTMTITVMPASGSSD